MKVKKKRRKPHLAGKGQDRRRAESKLGVAVRYETPEYNPREISDSSLSALRESLKIFGDLAGIVLNRRTSHIICANQRTRALGEGVLDTVKWGKRLEVELGYPGRRFRSVERRGVLKAEGGAEFQVREVSWPLPFEKAANVAANNPEIQGDFTDEIAGLLDEIRSDAGDDFESLGFSALLESLGLGEDLKDGETDPDQVPPPPEKPRSKRGRVYLLGQHRLMCGDSTISNDVEKLTAASKMDLCITSPPYNVNMKYASYKDKAAKKEYIDFITNIVRLAFVAMKNGRYVAWNIGVSPQTYPAYHTIIMEENGFYFQRQIVWEKSGVPYPIFGTTIKKKQARHYKPNYKHEIIQIFKKDSYDNAIMCPSCHGCGMVQGPKIGYANEHEEILLFTKGEEPEFGGKILPDKTYMNDVWKINQSKATKNLKTIGTVSSGLEKKGKKSHMLKEHPAAFPVEVPQAIMRFLTSKGEKSYDPFLGSGSTLIACEQLGRICYGMEIEPRYVDVARRRWAEFVHGEGCNWVKLTPEGK